MQHKSNEQKKFFAMLNGEQQGPFTIEELLSKGLTKDTFIWHQGLSNWKKAAEEPELNALWQLAKPSFETSNTAAPLQPQYNPAQGNNGNYPHPHLGHRLRGAPPKTYLVEAILVTFFCCMPFGIAAIVNANSVESRWYNGDEVGAWRASKQASKWSVVALIAGPVFIILYMLIMYLVAYNFSR